MGCSVRQTCGDPQHKPTLVLVHMLYTMHSIILAYLLDHQLLILEILILTQYLIYFVLWSLNKNKVKIMMAATKVQTAAIAKQADKHMTNNRKRLN